MKAYAKVNLTLDVVGEREDGYHLLRTIMTSIDIFDTVLVRPSADGEIRLISDVILPENNTLVSAAKAMRDKTGRGAVITLTKRIPSQAGMGGASADAAAVLLGMRALYAPRLCDAELAKTAEKIGADVPFCLTGGLALCEGIGEKLTPLPFKPMHFAIAKPKLGMSTHELFRSLERGKSFDASTTACKALKLNNLAAFARCVSNDLEAACEARVKEVGELCGRFTGLGADAAAMTGSGTAVFGLFLGEDGALALSRAQKAANALAAEGFWAKAASNVPRGIVED